MSIFFQDPHEVRLPPGEVRIQSVQVIPVSSSDRVRIKLELTPFQQRPNIEVTITSPADIEVAHTTILETVLPKLEFSMHIRNAKPGADYRVKTRIYYQKLPQASKEPADLELPEPEIIDQNITAFVFTKSAV